MFSIGLYRNLFVQLFGPNLENNRGGNVYKMLAVGV